MEFIVRHGRIRLSKSLSRILAKKGNRLMGRLEEMESGGLLGFGTRIIIENFQRVGKYESLRKELNKCVRWLIAFFGRHLAISAVM
jgi:hypothetical protein